MEATIASPLAKAERPSTSLPYGRQWVDEDDIAAVVEVLRSDWLTTGPTITHFEREFAVQVGSEHAVAVSSGTAALHTLMYAFGIGPGDEVIVPAMTFAATANCVVMQGAKPVFVDVDPATLLIDVDDVRRRISPRTRAIVAVDYCGQPCDYPALRSLASEHGLKLAADACHSLGAMLDGEPSGAFADASAFSFHPVKHITTGEGGIVATSDPEVARRARLFRNHGISTTFRDREAQASFYYEMLDLGWNYRLSDIACALGLSQLRKLPIWVQRRRRIAAAYDSAFAEMPGLKPLNSRPGVRNSYHLYVVQLDPAYWNADRDVVFRALRAQGIGVNVHYLPVHLHPYYRDRLGCKPGLCPVAERASQRILSLPIFPKMTDDDCDGVIEAVRAVYAAYRR
jgi:perosamine synthetase